MRSFVFVCDRPHLHLLLNEHFALRGIFLSADLGALSFWGESLLGGEKVEPTLLQEQPGQQHQPSTLLPLQLPAEPRCQAADCLGGIPACCQSTGSSADMGKATRCVCWCGCGKSPCEACCARESAAGWCRCAHSRPRGVDHHTSEPRSQLPVMGHESCTNQIPFCLPVPHFSRYNHWNYSNISLHPAGQQAGAGTGSAVCSRRCWSRAGGLGMAGTATPAGLWVQA